MGLIGVFLEKVRVWGRGERTVAGDKITGGTVYQG